MLNTCISISDFLLQIFCGSFAFADLTILLKLTFKDQNLTTLLRNLFKLLSVNHRQSFIYQS